ncbi:rRNA-processing protein FCF2 [Saccharata proteae CBS 121410]|uniref:rRNA-processing protein FCF2 n=1 Tax=Saccharata proteae CBS 121410 TaxID=1314787 RepID=A0A9P4I148_9PEZI|nr:rRNA-processing protein FCF2 [Saccharata proteae CBS 121410]
MAAPALSTHTASDDEDLSDDQIKALLEQAETSLREKKAESQLSRDFAAASFKLPKLDAGSLPSPYVQIDGEVAHVDSKRLLDSKQQRLANQIRKVEDPVVARKKLAEEKQATAGEKWYNMPKTDLTPELKRDLQLLKMRNVLDPHRHYKKEGGKFKAPEYSQVGTIVEGATEFFNARLQNKDRNKTLVEEVLAHENNTGRFKRKYGEIQQAKTSGKKAHYKALQAKRSGKVSKS